MKFKKITAIICAAALILSLAACAKKADYSGTTVVGKVTAADGNKVTVSIGTLDESADNAAKPDSDGTGDSQTPPEKPDGDSNSDSQTPPDMPDSDSNGDSQTPPDMSGGSSVTFTESGDTAEIDLSEATVTENGDFYGVNAALLATNGANVTIKNATVTSSSQNGNGIFSYGSGTINFNGYTITLADGTVLK